MNGRQILAGIVMALPLSAMAAPITGEIGLSGNVLPYCSGGGACDFSAGSADGLDFGSNGFGTDGGTLVTFATGDFGAGGELVFGDTGTITDFIFAPFGGAVTPLWSIAGNNYTWSFDLQSVNILFQDADFIDLTGTGILHSTDPGLDSTMGFWSFSADAAGSIFSWSSTNVPVAEPGILLVLGAGLFGLAAARRFRN